MAAARFAWERVATALLRKKSLTGAEARAIAPIEAKA